MNYSCFTDKFSRNSINYTFVDKYTTFTPLDLFYILFYNINELTMK